MLNNNAEVDIRDRQIFRSLSVLTTSNLKYNICMTLAFATWKYDRENK